MFSNKNNHLIKHILQKGSASAFEPFAPNLVPNPVPEPILNPNPNLEPVPVQNPGFVYPKDDYLYYKITSQDVHDNIKVYVCMFSTVNGYATFHMNKDTDVSIPSFVFTSNMPAPAPVPVAPIAPAPVPMAPAPMAPMAPAPMAPMAPAPVPMAPAPVPMAPAPVPMAPVPAPMAPAPVAPMAPMAPVAPAPVAPMAPVAPIIGGYVDTNELDDPLDTLFIQKCIEFTTQPSAIYKGYIPNIAEAGSVFAFVEVNPIPESNTSIPCISNELYYLKKVGNLNVSPTIEAMFSNNKWLVSASDPFSGYAYGAAEPSLIDIEPFGSYYYFSFLPVASTTVAPVATAAASPARYAIQPLEYECVTEVYPNFSSNSNSLYFDGQLINQSLAGQKFFAVTMPTQFSTI